MVGASQGANRPLVLRSSALKEERLLLMQTGSSSPCLDLRYPRGTPSPTLAPGARAGQQGSPVRLEPWVWAAFFPRGPGRVGSGPSAARPRRGLVGRMPRGWGCGHPACP